MDYFLDFADQGASMGRSFVRPFQDLLGELLSFTINQLIPFILVLIIGGLLIRLFMKLLNTVLHKSKLDKLFEKIGLTKELSHLGVKASISDILSRVIDISLKVVLWMTAIDMLKIRQLSEFMGKIVDFLPNIIVAIIILGVGLAIAKFVENIFNETTSGIKDKNTAKFLGRAAKISIIVLTIMTVLSQLNIAENLINTLMTGLIGAISIALGLAFGLGGQSQAKEWLEKWSHHKKKK